MEYITKHMRCKEFPQNITHGCARKKINNTIHAYTLLYMSVKEQLFFDCKWFAVCISTKCNCVCSILLRFFSLFLHIFGLPPARPIYLNIEHCLELFGHKKSTPMSERILFFHCIKKRKIDCSL